MPVFQLNPYELLHLLELEEAEVGFDRLGTLAERHSAYGNALH